MAQSVKHLTLAQVMISQFVGLSPVSVLCWQLRAWHGSQTHKLWDHDLSQSRTLNRLSHPGTPILLYLNKFPLNHIQEERHPLKRPGVIECQHCASIVLGAKDSVGSKTFLILVCILISKLHSKLKSQTTNLILAHCIQLYKSLAFAHPILFIFNSFFSSVFYLVEPTQPLNLSSNFTSLQLSFMLFPSYHPCGKLITSELWQ